MKVPTLWVEGPVVINVIRLLLRSAREPIMSTHPEATWFKNVAEVQRVEMKTQSHCVCVSRLEGETVVLNLLV